MISTKERIVAARQFSTERYIRSTHPVFYTNMRRDGTQFLSDDAYGHLCTVTGATWGLQGRSFNGTSDYLDIATSTLLQITDNLTIEAWIKPTSLPNPDHGIVGWSNASNWNFHLQDTGYLRFMITQTVGGTYAIVPSTSTPLNQWSHVVAISRTPPALPYIYIYQNTILTKSGQATDGGIKSTDWGSFVIGYYTSNTVDNFAGMIGEVRIYSRALSPLEIQQNYLLTRWRYQ